MGAMAEPLHWPGLGERVRNPLCRRAGPEPPSQPLHLPAPAEPPPPAPSFDLHHTRLLGKMTPNYHGNKNTGDGVGGRGDTGTAPRPAPTMEAGVAGAIACIPAGASRHSSPVSCITGVHPAWPSAPWGARSWAEGPGMLGTVSLPASLQRLRFPASSGLGFNYLNCNATGEREAGNLPGDAPAAPLLAGWGGSQAGGPSGSPHPEKNPPGLLGLGGLCLGSIRALCPSLRGARPEGGEPGAAPPAGLAAPCEAGRGSGCRGPAEA